MLQGLRESLSKKPWIGYALAGILLAVSLYLAFFRSSGESPYSPEAMTEMLTVRYTDTDEVVKIPRGRLDKELRGMGARLDPTQGLINPKTGKPTGFLVDDKEWNTMIARINQEREERKAQQAATAKGGVKPAPRTDVPKVVVPPEAQPEATSPK